MNQYKQSKSSIVLQTCWLAGPKGATTDGIEDALEEADFYMPLEKRLAPMLKTMLRKKQVKKIKGKWIVEKPYTP